MIISVEHLSLLRDSLRWIDSVHKLACFTTDPYRRACGNNVHFPRKLNVLTNPLLHEHFTFL
jgi:hypothetical protein